MAHEGRQGRRLSTTSTARTSADDLDLVARARTAGDADAFGELVRRHQSQVRLFLLRLCREPSEADDLAQDAFMHAWSKLASFRGDGSFIGWLLRIAWTTFLQARRRGDRYREVVEQAAREDERDSVMQPAEEAGDVDKLLAVLGEEERAIMILSYGLGLSHREISETTGLPVGTIKSIIFRGKEKIRQDFEIRHHQLG